MLEPATIVYDDGVLQLACSNDVYLERWVAPGAMPQFQAMREHHLAFLERGSGPWSAILIDLAMTSLRMPTEEERAVFGDRHHRMASKLAVAGMAITSPGFVTSIVRTVISALTMVQRTPYDYRICATTRDAIEWIAPRRKVPKSELVGPDAIEDWYRGTVARFKKPP